MYLLSWAVTHWKLLGVSGAFCSDPGASRCSFTNCPSLNFKPQIGEFASRFIYHLLNEVIFDYFWECYCGIMSWQCHFFPWSNYSCHHPSQGGPGRAPMPGSEQDFSPCGLNITCRQAESTTAAWASAFLACSADVQHWHLVLHFDF